MTYQQPTQNRGRDYGWLIAVVAVVILVVAFARMGGGGNGDRSTTEIIDHKDGSQTTRITDKHGNVTECTWNAANTKETCVDR